MTHNCGLEPAINWMVEHAQDDDIDTPLAVPPAASAEAAGQLAAAGHLPISQPVVGVPTDASLVVHPDGRAAPAHVVGVQGETKVSRSARTPDLMHCNACIASDGSGAGLSALM